ncbi:PRKR-interacting protein 1 [Nymphon striatum]|nr:PRKR-interacting protein 1 [Nymphon striatum]
MKTDLRKVEFYEILFDLVPYLSERACRKIHKQVGEVGFEDAVARALKHAPNKKGGYRFKDKPVDMPKPRKEKSLSQAPEFVRNIMGSSAGAGSGEFHVYRHIRRREYARQKFITEKTEQELKDDEYHKKIEDNKKSAETKTEKKRLKRLKKKAKMKQKKTEKPVESGKKESEDENMESEEEN